MRAIIAMALALWLFVALMHNRVKIGRSMILSGLALSLLLKVTPALIWQQLLFEWHNKPINQTTGYLIITLTALLLLVNVIGAAMRQTGVSQRLVPAIHGLFRSRRAALSVIPMIVGTLPTPGGIMLSAPMVRDLGDSIGVKRSRLAAINYYFRHQWESVWPLFPAISLIQGMLGVSVFSIISHNMVIMLFGIFGGIIFLLLTGIPPKGDKKVLHASLSHNLRGFMHAFWPIGFAACLYAGLNVPPAVGVFTAIIGFLLLHKVPFNTWPKIFKAAKEPDFALLVAGALFFKLNLEASGAISQITNLLIENNVPPLFIIFFLPMLVAYVTGITSVSVAISFPLLIPLIGTGNDARMGLETLAFSGVLCGLLTTPVHLCLPLSAGYFQAPLLKIIAKILLPVTFIAAAGVTMALFCG